MSERVVIVEDDVFLREELVSVIAGAGFEVVALERFDDSYDDITAASPQLVVLDLNLPQTSGFELVRRLRDEKVMGGGQRGEERPGEGSPSPESPSPGCFGQGRLGQGQLGQGNSVPLPILILTARDRLADELHALDLGADDYLTKPVEPARLLARIHSLLRRSALAAKTPQAEVLSNLLKGPGFLLDPQTFTLFVCEVSTSAEVEREDGPADSSLRLAPQEGRLLVALTEAQGTLVSKEVLHEALWGTIEFVDENALMVTLARLRKTLRSTCPGVRIETLRGEGLRLRAALER